MNRRHPLTDSGRRRPVRLHVEPLERRALLATLTVMTNADSGPGSLRDAISRVNTAASSGVTTIDFNIGSGGLQTIALQSALPKISYPVLIDGSSQPGTSTTPRIEINGASAGGGVVGLDLAGGNSTVQGLVVDGFGPSTGQSTSTGIGILLETVTTGDLVQGWFIGTDPTGTKASSNQVGVEIADANQLSTAIVGGTTAAARNVISGNGTGVVLAGGTVEGNDIGTDPTGTVAVPNGTGIIAVGTGYGLPPSGTAQGTIGGSVAGSGNFISGNSGVGISFDGGFFFLTQGNTIGLGSDGRALGNGGDGIAFNLEPPNSNYSPASVNDPIGGIGAGQGNTIADNKGAGVDLLPRVARYSADTASVTIRGNAIYGNGGLGIDLGDDGVTPNQPQSNVGPNFYQPYPVITSVTTSGGSTTVTGTLDSDPSSSYTVDLYGNATADPTRFGEGQQYLSTVSVITDGAGLGQFTSTFSTPSGLPFITATATDALYHNTSEFSEAASTTSSPLRADLSVTGSVSASQVMLGQSVVFTFLVTNNGPDPSVGTTLSENFDQHNTGYFSATKYLVGSKDVTSSVITSGGRITVGTIAPGQSVPVRITYSSVANPSYLNAQTLTETDTVTAISASSDPNPSNNKAAASFGLLSNPFAELSLATTPLSGRFSQDVPLTITIKVSNGGTADATGVVVDDTPPSSIDSFQASQGTSVLVQGTLSFSLGTIAAGATATIEIVITPSRPGLQSNTGGVQTFSTVGFTLNGFYSGSSDFGLLVIPRDVRSDYDGDGKTDIAATLPAFGLFAVRPSSGGGDRVGTFGPVGLGLSVPVSGLAGLSVAGSGVQAASVASVSAAAFPATSQVTTGTASKDATRPLVVGSSLPSGPARKALVVAQGGRRHHHQTVVGELA